MDYFFFLVLSVSLYLSLSLSLSLCLSLFETPSIDVKAFGEYTEMMK